MRSILLVEDDLTSRMVISALLEQQGFSVEQATSFASARELIAGGSAAYEVVLLDQNLGDGLGLDLVPLLRAKAPGARIILLSAETDFEPEGEHRVDHRVVKGVPFRHLLALINREMV